MKFSFFLPVDSLIRPASASWHYGSTMAHDQYLSDLHVTSRCYAEDIDVMLRTSMSRYLLAFHLLFNDAVWACSCFWLDAWLQHDTMYPLPSLKLATTYLTCILCSLLTFKTKTHASTLSEAQQACALLHHELRCSMRIRDILTLPLSVPLVSTPTHPSKRICLSNLTIKSLYGECAFECARVQRASQLQLVRNRLQQLLRA